MPTPSRAEQWKEAFKMRPSSFEHKDFEASVTNQGTLLLSLGDDLPVHARLDAFETKKLIAWLRENFE